MFERFSERGRQVVVIAQDEARRLQHNYVGTEHLLLALLDPQSGIARDALRKFGLSAEDVRAQIRAIIGTGQTTAAPQLPFTPRARRVLEVGLREMQELGHKRIGAEHLLLALIRDQDGLSARILIENGIELDALRQAILEKAPPDPEAAAAYTARQASAQRNLDRVQTIRPQRPGFEDTVTMDPALERLLILASAQARRDSRTALTLRDLLIVVRDDPSARRILDDVIAGS